MDHLTAMTAAVALMAIGAQCQASEPNIKAAMGWWSELPGKWTPVGWKDHLFRFNVLHNGTVLAIPDTNNRTEKFNGLGLQLSFPTLAPQRENNAVIQGWNDCPAPVMWSEFSVDGLLIRQEVFAHIPGGEDVHTGQEPLFAWMRLSVHDVCPGLPQDKDIGISVVLNAPYVTHSMEYRNNLTYHPEKSQYPRPLSAETEAYDPNAGYRITDPTSSPPYQGGARGGRAPQGSKIRLAIAPGQKLTASFAPHKPTERDYTLSVTLERKKGAHADILIPMLPVERDVFDKELALGYTKALVETNSYWSKTPNDAATFDCPEEHLNRLVEQNLKFAEIIANKEPDTGDYCLLSGAWCYTYWWSTPGTMAFASLDLMGYGSVAAKYLDVFRRSQGAAKPPGDYFTDYSGYLSPPKEICAITWLSDHGAILHTICEHAMLSGDSKTMQDWLPTVVKACDFIKAARRIGGHGGVEGIMPPAVATDAQTKTQAVWNDGWNYKGLTTAIRFLEKLNHPRAAEFAAEAADYRGVFQKALRKKTAAMPTWKDDSGKAHHLVPTALFGDKPWETRWPFYLDTGPLFMVYAGLMDANDKLMKSTLLWFREGPQAKWYRYDASTFQVACLPHEISSCEPCYSWNIFHSWQSADRTKFLEGMYSLFAGAYSQQTYTACETRGGITATCNWAPTVLLARLAVIDDQIKENELHLLRLVPLTWLRTDREARFESMPTEFGRVSLRAKLTDSGRTLRVSYSPTFHTPPKQVVLHVPPVKGLKKIMLNGKSMRWDGTKRQIVIGKA